MDLSARYHDGVVALVADVTCRIEGGVLTIAEEHTGTAIDTWPAALVFPVYGRSNELRIGVSGKPYGARLVFTGLNVANAARGALPALQERHRQDRGKQIRLVGLATFALASVVVAYIYGVPLLAARLTQLIPPAWEQEFGAKVAEQIEASLAEEGGFEVCDPDPDSLANRAISRFADAALEGAGSPFDPDVKVIRSTVPNAFALPGGKAFYFSALLDSTDSADEFAGVLAHELGHVVHRHAMENLIASAGTGLLIGFILGDMTGISVAGGLGSALIDSRFSREAEAQADQFAADTARRLGFSPLGLISLLGRVAQDDAFSKALALLSTHPLTEERRLALERLTVNDAALTPVFTAAEWQAIKTMCQPGAERVTPTRTPSEPGGATPQSKPDKNPSRG